MVRKKIKGRLRLGIQFHNQWQLYRAVPHIDVFRLTADAKGIAIMLMNFGMYVYLWRELPKPPIGDLSLKLKQEE